MADPAKESLNRMGQHIDEMDEYLRSTTPQEQGSGGSDANFDRPRPSQATPTTNLDKAKKAAKTYQKARNDRTFGPIIQQGEHFLKERVEKGIGKGLAKVVSKIAKNKNVDQPIKKTSAVNTALNVLPSILAVPFAVEGAVVGARTGGAQGAGAGLVGGFKAGRDIVGKPIKSIGEGIVKNYYEELNKPYQQNQERKRKEEASRQVKFGTPIHGGSVQFGQPASTPKKVKFDTRVTESPAATPTRPSATTPFYTPSPTHISSAGTTQSRLEFGPPVVRDSTPKSVQSSNYYQPQFIGASGYSGATPYYNYGYGKKTRRTRISTKRPAKGARRVKKRVSK